MFEITGENDYTVDGYGKGDTLAEAFRDWAETSEVMAQVTKWKPTVKQNGEIVQVWGSAQKSKIFM